MLTKRRSPGLLTPMGTDGALPGVTEGDPSSCYPAPLSGSGPAEPPESSAPVQQVACVHAHSKDAPMAAACKEVAFIDEGVTGVPALLAGIRPGVEPILLP